MSEERFIVGETLRDYYQIKCEKEDYSRVLAPNTVVVLLNEQQEKITELEIELTDCKNRKEQLEYKNTKLIAKIDFLERVIDGDV